MDVSTVNNAVSDALAGLPAGTSSFITANMGTLAGQQAIANAGASLGLSNAQIAAAVSQVTGQTITPQQVAQVASGAGSEKAPPVYNAPPPPFAPPPPAAPDQTSLGNIAAPVNPVNQPFTSTNPGGVGVSYGQADPKLLGQAQADYPELSKALANGTLSLMQGPDENYLYDTKTGQQINGNYQITTTPSGGVAINLGLSNGAMVQVATGLNQNGTLAPVTASNVYNVGLNSSEGGFAGGLSNFTPAIRAGALLYGGSQLAGALAGGATGATGLSALDAGMGVYPSTGVIGAGTAAGAAGAAGLAGSAGGAGTTLSALDAGMGVYPSTGTIGAVGAGAAGATGLAGATGAGAGTAGATGAGTAGAVGAGTAGALGAGTSALDAGMGVYPSTGTIGAGLTGVGAASLLTPTNVLAGSALLNTLGAANTNKAISNAAGSQAQAGQNAQTAITDFGKTYGQLQAPYQQTGVQALNTLGSLGSGTFNIMNPDGTVNKTGTGNDYLTHQFNAQDLQAGLAPNYDFMLAQGAGANRNLANASGGQISGNTLQGLNTFNQNYASNAYQNAFNNYQTQRQNIFANLAQQAGLGGTSLGQLGSVGSSLANTYGNLTTGLAASQAGATTAQAVNTQNALSNIGNTALLSSLIKPTAPNLA
jgi:hypothetical protein